jgi:hypothetical protein
MRVTLPRRRSPIVLVFVLVTACFDASFDGTFPEPDDVRLAVPGRAAASGTGERGEAYTLVAATATAVDGWVADVVSGLATVVQPLADHRESSRDGSWLVFGPFDDDARDLAWLVQIDDGAHEVWVGRAGARGRAAMDLLMVGNIALDGDVRSGAFSLDMSTLDGHPAISAGAGASGSIDVTFERDVSTDRKHVDIAFVDFHALEWSSDDTYAFRREPDGSGAFDLARAGDFAGRQVDRVELEMRWREDLSGRARGIVLDVDNGLPHGDLVLDECFDAAGVLSYRDLTDAYAVDLPGYAFGDERTCVFAADEL